MPDPRNVRRCWWHARDYGFVGANPYGVNAFTKGAASRVVVRRGESHRLRYGILLHGELQDSAAEIRKAYADYLNLIRR